MFVSIPHYTGIPSKVVVVDMSYPGSLFRDLLLLLLLLLLHCCGNTPVSCTGAAVVQA